MRKLALSDDILLKIEKPARYIGNEVNSIMKDKEQIAIRFAMCFPDVYEIGMSHLGIQILCFFFLCWIFFFSSGSGSSATHAPQCGQRFGVPRPRCSPHLGQR